MAFYTRINKAYASRVQKVTKSITIADLTAAALSQAIDFDAALPAGALVVGGDVNATAKFTGGGATSCEADLGIKTVDADGVVDGIDIFTAVIRGSLPRGLSFPSFQGGQTPQMTITSDVNVNLLTTGALTATIYYIDTAAL